MSQPQTPSPQWAAFCADIKAKTARKPRQPKPKKTVSANELTRQIVKFLRGQGAFATRLDSKGTFRVDLQKFVPSQQVAGLPDAFAVFESRAIFCEIKTPADRLSQVQKDTINQLTQAGAAVFIARDFESFREWFVREFQSPPCA